MKKILLLLLLFSFIKFSIAQQGVIDSLMSALNTVKTDTARIKIFLQLSDKYQNLNPDSAIMSGNNGLMLSKKINNLNWQAKSYHELGWCYVGKADYKKAKEVFTQGLELYTQIKDEKGMADAWNDLGVVASYTGELDSSLILYLKAVGYQEKIGNKKDMASLYSNIGEIYSLKGDHAKWLEYLLKDLKITETLGDKRALGISYTHLGLFYQQTDDIKQALVSIFKAKEIFEQIKEDKTSLGVCYHILGEIYFGMKDLVKAKECFTTSLKIHSETGNTDQIANSLFSLGIVCDSLGDKQKALEYYVQAKPMFEESGNVSDLASVYQYIGNIYSHNGDHKKAIDMLKESLKLSISSGDPVFIREANYYLSAEYEKTGNIHEALAYYKSYSDMKDSILSLEKIKQIAQMQTKYETEKKDDQISLQTAEIEKQKTIRNSVIGGVSLVGIFSLLLITSRNRRKKVAVEKQMAEVEMKALRAQMNPHFIFNSLNSIMRFVKRNDAASAEDYLGKFSKLIRIILENSRQQEVTLASDLQALQLYMDLEAMRLENKFQYKIEVGEGMDKETVYVPPLLLQPFVENSIWHGISQKEGKGNIVVRIRRENEMLVCEVEDDGVGRRQRDEGHGMKDDMEATVPRPASPVPFKESLGMTITGERLNLINQQRKLKATMNVVDLENGTFVVVSLPYVVETN